MNIYAETEIKSNQIFFAVILDNHLCFIIYISASGANSRFEEDPDLLNGKDDNIEMFHDE